MINGNILALKTNIEHWRSTKMLFIDKVLSNHGVKQVDMLWTNCELLKDDKNHFTWRGLKMFIKLLTQKLTLLGIKNVHVISDSTLAWWNYDINGDFNNAANNLFIDECNRKGINATIKAINGAGFKQRYDEGLDFSTLLNNSIIGRNNKIFIIGGWNDESFDQETIKTSIDSFINICKEKSH